MIERVIPLVLCGLLAACSDPLAGLDRISDVDLNENDPSAAALPSEDEIAREGYFGTSAAEGDVPAGVAAPVAKQTPAKSGFFDLFRAALQMNKQMPLPLQSHKPKAKRRMRHHRLKHRPMKPRS
jgi:hypothetical protein